MARAVRVGEAPIMSTWLQTEAEKAFGRATRSRARARLVSHLRRCGGACLRLAVAEPAAPARRAGRGVREIPLESITGTLEPHRAEQFDPAFRPAAIVRERWQRRLARGGARRRAAADLGRARRRRLRGPRRPPSRLGRARARRGDDRRGRQRGLSSTTSSGAPRHHALGQRALELGQPRLLGRVALRRAGEVDELLVDEALAQQELDRPPAAREPPREALEHAAALRPRELRPRRGSGRRSPRA